MSDKSFNPFHIYFCYFHSKYFDKTSVTRISGIAKIFFICLSLLWQGSLLAQENPDLKKDNLIEQRIENLAETQEDSDTDYSNLLEDLLQYKKNPLNLNRAGVDELNALGLLNEFQINALLRHREQAGRLISIFELQGIDGFDLETIQKILPFVMVSDQFDDLNISLSEIFRNGKHQIVGRTSFVLEEQKGFSPITDSALAANPNARYLGNKYGMFFRYRFTYGNRVSIALTGDKDPGEQFAKGAQKNGFDFYSGHLALRNVRGFKVLVLGDYLAQFGQGLTLWMGQGFGKTADPSLIKRSARGITPSNSINEALFLRGAAATFVKNKIEITGFYSQKKIDGTLVDRDTLDASNIEQISSLLLSGFHRTPSENANRKFVTEEIMGGNASYRSRKLSFGFTGAYTQYGLNLNRDLDIRNQFDFSSSKNLNYGADYNFLVRNLNFFGEVSRSLNGGMSQIHGLLASLDPKLAVSLLYRNFGSDFQSLLTNAVGESSKSSNEDGLYLGGVLRPSSKISINGYYDLYRFPWLRFQTSAPSYGTDYFGQINYVPSKRTELYVRYRRRTKFVDAEENLLPLESIVPYTQENFRFNVLYPVGNEFRFRNRVEWVRINTEGNNINGFMFYQDISYKPLNSSLSITLRYALFDAEDYISRIYAFESDVLYAFSIPAFYDKGNRFYCLLNYNLTRNTEIWLRYAITSYHNRPVISEGSLNEIQGNRRSDVRVQFRITF